MRFRIFFSVLATAFFIVAVSCASSPESPSRSSESPRRVEPLRSNAPGWASQVQFVEGGHTYFAGRASGFRDEAECHENALRDALNIVSRYVRVEHRSLSKSYEEHIGESSELVQSASIERGTFITFRDYFKDYFSERYYEGGAVLHQCFVKIGFTKEEMARMKVQSENETAWKINSSGSCSFNIKEAETLFKEFSYLRGWKLSSKQSDSGKSQQNTLPSSNYYADVSVSCSEEGAKILIKRYDLIDRSIVMTVSAFGTDIGEIKKSLFQKTGIYRPLMDFPEYSDPEKSGLLDKIDVDLLNLYNKALYFEKRGRLFPEKALKSWKAVSEYDGKNELKDFAEERVGFYSNLKDRKSTVAAKEAEKRAKLKEIIGLESMDEKEMAQLLIDYIEGYGAYAGNNIINGIIDEIKPAQRKENIRKLVFEDKNMSGRWKASCLNGDGAKCYIYSLTKSDESFEFKKKSCDMSVKKGCLELAEEAEKKEQGVNAAYFGEKACHLGAEDWCFKAGDIYYSGKYGVKTDVERSYSVLKDSCDAGNIRGCAYLGYIHEHGETGKKDISKAKYYYKLGCDLGSRDLCKRADGL
jgi:TPR repeat protein